VSFSDAEAQYLDSQPFGRLATVGADGRPHVTPVGFFYDRESSTIVIGSSGDMAKSKKFRDAQHHPDVAFVIDDLASTDPWTPRGMEIRGRAEALTEGGEQAGERLGAGFAFNSAWIRIHPQRVISWGIDGDSFTRSARDVSAS
jgi:pyridoxamine 5'-phosphate oxidase family protein